MTKRLPVPGEGWETGPDGMPFRRAARLVLFGPAGRVLLATGHDVAQPERRWLFTPGGGIDPGESPRQAAVRELREESGIALAPASLAGPVAVRSSVFDFYERSVRQDEVFFRATLPRPAAGAGGGAVVVANHDDEPPTLDDSGWTDVERAFMEELGWWEPAALARVGSERGLELFPRRLPELVAWLAPGWDGAVWRLGT